MALLHACRAKPTEAQPLDFLRQSTNLAKQPRSIMDSHNFERLRAHILPLSVSQAFDVARTEWVLAAIEISEELDSREQPTSGGVHVQSKVARAAVSNAIGKPIIGIDPPRQQIDLAPIDFRLQESHLGLPGFISHIDEPGFGRPAPLPVPPIAPRLQHIL